MSEDRAKQERYRACAARIASLLEDEDDWVAAMATVVCELHASFDHFDWTGFYRHARARLLIIGPYQGGHGCLRIAFDRGVCGEAARTRTTQLVDDVAAVPDHIACSASTRSEIVVPVLAPSGALIAVLDVDSDRLAAFDAVDQRWLESIAASLGERFAHEALP